MVSEIIKLIIALLCMRVSWGNSIIGLAFGVVFIISVFSPFFKKSPEWDAVHDFSFLGMVGSAVISLGSTVYAGGDATLGLGGIRLVIYILSWLILVCVGVMMLMVLRGYNLGYYERYHQNALIIELRHKELSKLLDGKAWFTSLKDYGEFLEAREEFIKSGTGILTGDIRVIQDMDVKTRGILATVLDDTLKPCIDNGNVRKIFFVGYYHVPKSPIDEDYGIWKRVQDQIDSRRRECMRLRDRGELSGELLEWLEYSEKAEDLPKNDTQDA